MLYYVIVTFLTSLKENLILLQNTQLAEQLSHFLCNTFVFHSEQRIFVGHKSIPMLTKCWLDIKVIDS